MQMCNGIGNLLPLTNTVLGFYQIVYGLGYGWGSREPVSAFTDGRLHSHRGYWPLDH